MSKAVRVLVADNHPLTARAQFVLSATPDFDCVGPVYDYAQFQKLVCLKRPDVILLSAEDLAAYADDMVASVLETAPHTKILVLADHHCPLCMHRLVEQGIAGYVVRKEFAERSVEVTGTLVCRGFYFDLGPVHSQPRTPTETPLLHTHTHGLTISLTVKELAILQLLVDGYTDQKMASTFGIAERTVRKHLRQVIGPLAGLLLLAGSYSEHEDNIHLLKPPPKRIVYFFVIGSVIVLLIISWILGLNI